MTDHLLIATAATETKGYFPQLHYQVVAPGIDFLYQPLPQPFTWKQLIDWEYLLAKSYPNALIAFCDTWDMLFMGSRKEFEDVVGAQPLLFHTDKLCWPHPEKAKLYPQTDFPSRYVNGTGPAGLGSAIAEAIEFGMEHFPITAENTGSDVYDITKDNDQRFYTDIYLSGIGSLDTSWRLSQSLVDIRAGELSGEGWQALQQGDEHLPALRPCQRCALYDGSAWAHGSTLCLQAGAAVVGSLEIDIETSTTCNAACRFCPYPKTADWRAGQIMDMKLFEKIIDELVTIPQVHDIRLNGLNEPLLDRHLDAR